MNKKLKALMLFNVLFYVNNFILIALTNAFGLEGIAALWFFTPFILILFTTWMIESPKRKLIGTIKKVAILDFALRCIILIINYLALSELILVPFVYLIGLSIIFMVLNVYIEWKMYQQLPPFSMEDELTKQEINDLIEDYNNDKTIMIGKSPSEKKELNEILHSIVYIGYSNVLIVLLVLGGVFAFAYAGERERLFIFAIAFLLLMVYFYLTEKKLALYVKDTRRRMIIRLRDNITLLIGVSIIYIMQGILYLGTVTFNVFGIFLACIFFLPTMNTNQLIRESFHQTN